MTFTESLIDQDIEAIRKSPKADLHNHFVLGGSRKYLLEHSGRDIRPITYPLSSMDEMHAWNAENIGAFFDTPEAGHYALLFFELILFALWHIIPSLTVVGYKKSHNPCI